MGRPIHHIPVSHLTRHLLLVALLCGVPFPRGVAAAVEDHDLLTVEERAWLEAHPDITLAYTDSLEPAVIAGPEGRHTGMLVDALEQINRRLGTRIGLRLYDIPEALDHAQKKKVDGILALTPEYAEELGLLPTRAFWRDYLAVFARRDTSFRGPEDFADRRVALIDKVYITRKMIDDHGQGTTVVKVPTALEGLRAVARGDADLFLGGSYSSYFLTKYQLLELVPAHVFIDTPAWQSIAVRPDWPELVPILNKALAQFSEEDIHNIIRKWSYLPIELNRVTLTPEEEAWLARGQVVRVHVAKNAPFLIVGDGEPSGMAIDYLRMVSDRTGIHFEWVYEPVSMGSAGEMMKRGDGPDLLPATMPLARWESSISFTAPYLVSPVVIFTRDAHEFIAGIEDLSGKAVSATRNTPLTARIADDYPDVHLQEFDTAEQAMLALASGEVDAFVGNIAVGTHLIRDHQLADIKVAAPSPLPNRELAFGIRKDWPELTSILDQSPVSIQIHGLDGKLIQSNPAYAKLYAFNSEVLLDLSSPVLNELGLSTALADWLEEHIGRGHGLTTSFADEAGDAPLSDDLRAVLFRNTRELLQNVIKHAQAKSVSVRLVTSEDVLRISVQDDGAGFDPDAVARRSIANGSFGLFSVHERMADLGGELEIVSAPGQGCTATLTVPMGS